MNTIYSFKFTLLLFVAVLFVPFASVHAQVNELAQEQSEIVKAEVQSITKTTYEQLGWNEDVLVTVQHITARILTGDTVGEVVELKNEFTELSVGDSLYVNHIVDFNGFESYFIYEEDRMGSIAVIIGFFVLLLLLFGGMQGLRSLIALAGSLLAIAFVLIPAILAGYNPVIVSVLVASAILFMALFFTHGFNRGSLIAFIGTVTAVLITGVLAYFAIDITHLSGMTGEEQTYLKFNSGGSLDFVGLLLGAIIIGALGALDDIAVTQVAVVRELFAANRKLHFMEVYKKAMRVGKDHVGALVNTLVLAYTGTALPLLLLYSQTNASSVPFINLELFATEIVRMVVGSAGLVLAVPITTLLAVYFMRDAGPLPEGFGHSHSH